MISSNQFKNGMTIELSSGIFSIISSQHVKPGKGHAFVRTKLRNLDSGNVIEKTFRAGEKVEQAFVEEKKMQFLYRQGQIYHFMDQQTFEELELPKKKLGEQVRFIKENMVISVLVCKGKIVEIKAPIFVELKVVRTDPGLRADTVKTPTKSAVLETDVVVEVPLFTKVGDILKIDTRTGEYIGRV